MPDALRSLQEDHANMAKLLDAVERQLAVIDQGEQPDYDIIQGVLDYCLSYPDLYHHPKEDLILARLRARDPAAAAALGDLQAEHEALAALTRRLAAAVHAVLQDLEVPRESVGRAARSFLEAYREHMDLEDKVLFPAASRGLTAADWDDIEAQAAERDDPLFGKVTEARFKALRNEILGWAENNS